MEILHARGYTLNFAPELMPLVDIHGLSDGRFDGLVWVDIVLAGPVAEAFYGSPVPVVAIGGIASPTPERGALYGFDEEGSYTLLLDHLTELGHRSILFSSSVAQLADGAIELRRDGFATAALERGLKFAALASEDEMKAIASWRELPERPTAIVSPSDR